MNHVDSLEVSFLFDLTFRQYLHTRYARFVYRSHLAHTLCNHRRQLSFFPTRSAWSYEYDWESRRCQGLRITRYTSKFRKACQIKRQGQKLQLASSTDLCKPNARNHLSSSMVLHANLELHNIAQAHNLTLRDGTEHPSSTFEAWNCSAWQTDRSPVVVHRNTIKDSRFKLT